MGVYDLYSKRKQRERGETPDVLIYDRISEGLRRQICYLFEDLLGTRDSWAGSSTCQEAYAAVVDTLRREYGVSVLVPEGRNDSFMDLHNFVVREKNVDRVLDAVELVFRAAPRFGVRLVQRQKTAPATQELNARFLEHGVGYQFEAEEIIRTDSKLLHQEVVRPALQLLSDPAFRGAEEEFLQAFEHHRHANEKDALTWSLKSLESTLKVICGKRGWSPTGQAKDLLDTVFDKGLIEPMWQSEFSGLRSVLESGIPTARNKLAGHGQGGRPVTVPGYLAAFVIHQTAAAIVFLVEAHKAKP